VRDSTERETIEVEGTVLDVGRGDQHHVEVVTGAVTRTVLARRSGRLNLHRIKIVAGDRVRLELSPYDPTRGRITRRL
jgi:translation initiation factor IF-1